MSISDSMRLTYADFKRLPRNDKRMLLQQLPYEDFVTLTSVLKLPVSTQTASLEAMTLEELISKQRGS
jgi:hypothetical protein